MRKYLKEAVTSRSKNTKSTQTGRRYDDEFKKAVVNLVVVQGYSFQAAADAVGVSSRRFQMVKRKVAKSKKAPKRAKTDRFPLIDKALRKRTKEDVITLILRLAKHQGEFARALESELDIEKPHDLLVEDIAAAIDRATDFDEGKLNHNFDYDWQAYKDTEEGFRKLVKLGHLEDAKALALKLMKDGSYQVECSDEGMMTDDITDCLKPVILAVKKDGGEQANKWALKMLLADRVGFICDNELKAMSKQS